MHHCQFNELKINMKNIHGNKSDTWMAQLPAIVDKLSELWKLNKITPVDNMSFHFLAKAESEENGNVVLKIGLDKKAVQTEMKALKFFDNHAAVKFLDYNAEYNALLLQQAIPGTTLKSIYPEHTEIAMNAYIETIQQLHSSKRISHFQFPHVRDWLYP